MCAAVDSKYPKPFIYRVLEARDRGEFCKCKGHHDSTHGRDETGKRICICDKCQLVIENWKDCYVCQLNVKNQNLTIESLMNIDVTFEDIVRLRDNLNSMVESKNVCEGYSWVCKDNTILSFRFHPENGDRPLDLKDKKWKNSDIITISVIKRTEHET